MAFRYSHSYMKVLQVKLGKMVTFDGILIL